MEKLSESQRAGITKTSDDRLRNKLSKAGYDPKVLDQFTRADLVRAMAELILSEDREVEMAARANVEEDEEGYGNGCQN